MPSDRNTPSEHALESRLQKAAALKKQMEWLSRQLGGCGTPEPAGNREEEKLFFRDDGDDARTDNRRGNRAGTLHESAAPYHVSAPASLPPDFPSDDVTLELPPSKRSGMSVAGYESMEAVAARPAFVRRTIRRSMYVANDDSGMAGAAPAPALFPDPSGGPLKFDASFVACVTNYLLAGMAFRAISRLLEMESGLVVSETALRGLVLAAAETVAPVYAAMTVQTIPDWTNLRRMFEEAKTGGDWIADGFLQKIHALRELEVHARIRADRLGGAPEDLYRERRAARTESARIAASFFDQCREALPVQNPQSPLAAAIRCALEHECTLSEFLHDPALELSRTISETPADEPFAVLAVCADECRMHGVPFRAWLENTIVRLKQPVPPPFKELFPH